MFEEGYLAYFDEVYTQFIDFLFFELGAVLFELVKTVEEVTGVEVVLDEEVGRSFDLVVPFINDYALPPFRDGIEQKPIRVEIVLVENGGYLA